MTVERIAHMDWEVTNLNGAKLYTNTTEGITGVAYVRDGSTFSTVIMVDDETTPRYVYDNAEYSAWNVPGLWRILESLAENMYNVEQDMIEESYDSLYEIGEDYDDSDSYDYEYERDSDLHNEW